MDMDEPVDGPCTRNPAVEENTGVLIINYVMLKKKKKKR